MRGTSLISLLVALQSGLAQPTSSNQSSFYFTGEVSAKGIAPSPSGKFGALRVNFGVVTPGASCSMSARLSSPKGEWFEYQHSTLDSKLPAGRSVLTLDFFGPKIARQPADSPLFLYQLTMICWVDNERIPHEARDDERRRIADLRPSDFDDPPPDFNLVSPQGPIRIAAGDVIYPEILIRTTGVMDDSFQLVYEATDSRMHVSIRTNPVSCESLLTYWRQGQRLSVSINTDPDIPPGGYGVRILARTSGLSRSTKLSIVVDPELTRRKQEEASARAAALNKLNREEPVLPIPAAPKPLKDITANFSTGTALRKIHAVLVLDRSGSMTVRDSCDFMKAAATGFSRLFVDGRDWLGVVSFGQTVQTILPLTDYFKADAPNRISAINCFGGTNTGEALEIAQQELDRHQDPEAINAVILFTDGLPNELTAKWSVTDPRRCAEAQSGEVAASLSVQSEMFVAAEMSEKEESLLNTWRPGSTSCFGNWGRSDHFQYIPETDLHGVPLVGSHPLERFADGPFAGKIRLDRRENIENAIVNQVENAAKQLRSDPRHPAFVYVIAFDNGPGADVAGPQSPLKNLANESTAPFFHPDQPAGSVIVTKGPEEFFPAFQRIRKEIIGHAEVR